MERPRYAAALLSALAFPGAGQIYNGDRAKGAALIAGTLGAVAALFWIVGSALWPLVLDDTVPLAPFDIAQTLALASAIQASHGRALLAVHVWLGVLWLVSVLDAWWVARRRAERNPSGGGTS